MTINLTPDQDCFVETKLQSGKYRSTKEVLEIALQMIFRHGT